MATKTFAEDPTITYRDAYVDFFNELLKNAYENLELIVRREKAGKKVSSEARRYARDSERWLYDSKKDCFRLPYHVVCEFLRLDPQ